MNMEQDQLSHNANDEAASVEGDIQEKSERSTIKAPLSAILRVPQMEDCEPFDIGDIISQLKVENAAVHTKMLKRINTRLKNGTENNIIRALVEQGLVEICANIIISTEVPVVAFEALSTLLWLSYGDDYIDTIVKNNQILAVLVELLGSNANFADKAAIILGNIAASSALHRNVLLDHGIVDALLSLSRKYIPLMLRKKVAWLISSVFRSNYLPTKFPTLKPLLAFVLQMFRENTDHEILFDLILVLHRLTVIGNVDIIREAQEAELLTELHRMVDSDEPKIVAVALLVIGNICSSEFETKGDGYMSPELLEKIGFMIIKFSGTDVVKNSLRLLRILTTDSSKHIPAILNINIFNEIKDILSDGPPECQMDAARILTNISCNGRTEQKFEVFISMMMLEPFCDLLTTSDLEMIQVVLIGIKNVLNLPIELEKEIDVIENMKALTSHKNETIQNLSVSIMEKILQVKGSACSINN